MNIFLRSVLDRRRIGSPLHFQSHSSLMSQTGHNVKLNGRAQVPADLCRTSADNHKKVKFANNNQLNNDNDNNGCGGDNNGDVGSCCSILNVRGLTSVLNSNTTTTMNNHDDDGDNDGT